MAQYHLHLKNHSTYSILFLYPLEYYQCAYVTIHMYLRSKYLQFNSIHYLYSLYSFQMALISNQSMTTEENDPDDIISTYCFNASTLNNTRTLEKETVFWLEGVMLTATSIIGIIGNSITIAVLNRISLNNVFNQVRTNAYYNTISRQIKKC